MLAASLALVAGLVLLVGGGEFLVRGAVALAEKAGLSQLLIGLTIVAFGTSAPELVASIEAVRSNAPAIAWGNIIGSNLANSLLILGLAAVIFPLAVERKPLWRDAGLALAVTAALYLGALGNMIGTVAGIAALMLLAAYIVFAYFSERASGAAQKEARAAASDGEESAKATPLWRSVLYLIGGLAGIGFGGEWLISGAVDIATYFGLSQTTIGLTIVAIGTSLPEAVTTIIAAMKKASAVALGNILGSNLFNLLLIGGVTALAAPNSMPAELISFGLPYLLAITVIMLFFAVTHYRVGRREGGVLLALFVVQLVFSVHSA